MLLRGTPVFVEWDGAMQLYSGRELVTGAGYHGWAAHFWPPLFSMLIGVGAHLVSAHIAGRIISLLAAVAVLLIVYGAVVLVSGSRAAGVLAQVLLVTNATFVRESLQAQNRMLEAALLLGCLCALLFADRRRSVQWFVAAGILAGFAGLTRYTSYCLFPLGVAVALLAPQTTALKQRVSFAAAFCIAAGIVSLPWWIYNTVSNGSPLSTWHYLNVGMMVVSRANPKVTQPQFLWSLQGGISSVSDVVHHYPRAFVGNYLHNLVQSVWLPVKLALPWSILIIPAILDAALSLRGRTIRDVAIVVGAFVVWAALASQALIPDYSCLVWVTILLIVVALFAVAYARRLRAALGHRSIAGAALVCAVLVMLSLRSAWHAVRDYRYEARDGGHLLPDALRVYATLRQQDAALSHKYVMAFHPGWAYQLGSRYLALPTYFVGSADSLVTYGGLSPAVRRYAPKVPGTLPIDGLRADYLVFDSSAARSDPSLAYLLDPRSSQVPRYFEPRYRSARTVVYAIDWAADSALGKPSPR